MKDTPIIRVIHTQDEPFPGDDTPRDNNYLFFVIDKEIGVAYIAFYDGTDWVKVTNMPIDTYRYRILHGGIIGEIS